MSKACIITPAYNGKQFLENVSIPSVRAQTFHDWTHYIVHDGPEKDDTADFIKKLDEPRIVYKQIPRVIPEPANGRWFSDGEKHYYTICGFNCTNHARSLIDQHHDCKYIFHINQDDAWTNDHLETMIRVLDAHPDHYMAWPVSLIYESNYFIHYMGKPFCRDTIFNSPWGGPAWSSICYRKEGPYHQFFGGQPGVCSDWEWLKNFLNATNKPALYVPKPTAFIFRHCTVDFSANIIKGMSYVIGLR